MKKMLPLLVLSSAAFLTACGTDTPATTAPAATVPATTVVAEPATTTPTATDASATIEPRAMFEIDRVYVDGEQVSIVDTNYENSSLIFLGEEQGGTVMIQVGENLISASINPSREHPSFETGEWHHHLYAGSSAQGSPRINFYESFTNLGIDANPEATDNTQSASQHGNLHYIVDNNEFRLRFTIDGVFHELMFVQV